MKAPRASSSDAEDSWASWDSSIIGVSKEPFKPIDLADNCCLLFIQGMRITQLLKNFAGQPKTPTQFMDSFGDMVGVLEDHC